MDMYSFNKKIHKTSYNILKKAWFDKTCAEL